MWCVMCECGCVSVDVWCVGVVGSAESVGSGWCECGR